MDYHSIFSLVFAGQQHIPYRVKIVKPANSTLRQILKVTLTYSVNLNASKSIQSQVHLSSAG